MSEFGKRLVKAAKEARSIARGEADPSTYAVYIPDEVDVRAIRQRLKMTQNEFGLRFGFGARVRDWEQNRKKPDAATRAFLIVIEKETQAVERALAAVA